MTALSAFGLFAVAAMLVCYALEERSRSFTLAFAVAGSLYGFSKAPGPLDWLSPYGHWSRSENGSEEEALTSMPVVRPAILDDLPALTHIYNHYVINTAITFDLPPFTPEERRAWFDDHANSGRYRFTGGARFTRRAVGRRHDEMLATQGRVRDNGRGERVLPSRSDRTRVWSGAVPAVFDVTAAEDVRTIVAGVSLPNPASIRLHERFGFQPVGVFHGVGRRFDKYWDVAWFERGLAPSD
jgi:phosphinothricin acetyltransferase